MFDLLEKLYIAYRRSPLGRELGRHRRNANRLKPASQRSLQIRRFPGRKRYLWQERQKKLFSSLARSIYQWRASSSAPTPAKSPVQVVCLADTHTRELPVPTGDILIHAGDLSMWGTFDEIQAQLDWLNSLPHPHKIVVAGNHDLLLDAEFSPYELVEEVPGKTRTDLRWGDIKYLEDQSEVLRMSTGRSIRIFGSPRTPCLGKGAFKYRRSFDIWGDSIPLETDILVTHGAPNGHLDGGGQGCRHILAQLWRVRPTLAVFGHVHMGHGTEVFGFNALDKAFEDVMVCQRGLWRCIKMFGLLLWQRLFFGLGIKSVETKVTLLVNAAVGGPSSKFHKNAIVVEI